MRVAIYAHVPTEHQELQQTIDSQLAALRAWAGHASPTSTYSVTRATAAAGSTGPADACVTPSDTGP
jgi:hypothetical protein